MPNEAFDGAITRKMMQHGDQERYRLHLVKRVSFVFEKM